MFSNNNKNFVINLAGIDNAGVDLTGTEPKTLVIWTPQNDIYIKLVSVGSSTIATANDFLLPQNQPISLTVSRALDRVVAIKTGAGAGRVYIMVLF